HRIQHDHHEDRLDHRRGGVGADRFGAAGHLETFQATDGRDQEGEERRLGQAHQEVLHADVAFQQRQEHRRRDVQRHRAHHGAADDAAQHRDEGQQWQRDQQRQHPRHHQQLDRVQAQGADRVDFLVGLHRADLRGEGAGGASCHQDGGKQHAEFTQERERHQVDGEDARAETGQHRGAQKGHHRTHQKGQQRDDGRRVQAGLFDVRDHGSHAPAPGLQQAPRQGGDDQADEAEQLPGVLPQHVDCPADAAQQLGQHGRFRLALWQAVVLKRAVHGVQQGAVGGRQRAGVVIGQLPQALGTQQFDQQRGAGGVQLAQLGEVDLGAGIVLAVQGLGAALERRVVGQGPVAGDAQAGRAARGSRQSGRRSSAPGQSIASLGDGCLTVINHLEAQHADHLAVFGEHAHLPVPDRVAGEHLLVGPGAVALLAPAIDVQGNAIDLFAVLFPYVVDAFVEAARGLDRGIGIEPGAADLAGADLLQAVAGAAAANGQGDQHQHGGTAPVIDREAAGQARERQQHGDAQRQLEALRRGQVQDDRQRREQRGEQGQDVQ
uniref:PE-PGRS family protein n=1 Tax=Steinernema glaseri TaxID=37863 RepID=A0A1I8AM75_9BILA